MLQSPFRQPPGKAGPAFPMDRPKEKAARMGRRFVLFNKEQQRDGKGAVGRAPIWPPDGEARARPPLFFILKGRGRQQPDVPLKQNSTRWGTLRKEGIPTALCLTSFGLWGAQSDARCTYGHRLSLCRFQNKKIPKKLLTFKYNEYMLI